MSLGQHCRNGDGVGFLPGVFGGLSSCPKLGLISLLLHVTDRAVLLFWRAEYSIVPVS